MDKNKNRTDLLAAGRKKLQQYRQKKDGKGGKSSGKANKPEPDVVADESSSFSKSTKGKIQLPAPEAPVEGSTTEAPVEGSATEAPVESLATEAPVGGSVAELANSSNDGVTTPDLSTSNLPIEVAEADESINVSVPDEDLHSSNIDDVTLTVSSPRTVNIEGNSESGHVPVTPVGLKAVLDDGFARKAGEAKAVSGEDQEQDISCAEPDNNTSSIELEVNETAQIFKGEVEEDSKRDNTSSAIEQNSECEHDVVSNSSDLHSSSALPSSDPELQILPIEDVAVGFHSGDELRPTLGESEVNPVSHTQLAKARELVGGDLKTDVDMKSGSIEISERLRDQLYIYNIEKELLYMQLCEELNERKEFDYEKSSSSAFSDLEGKNKLLSEELAKHKSELNRVTGEMEKLQREFSISKTDLDQSSVRLEELQVELEKSEHQLSNVSSELVDCRSLLSDFQAKNENLNLYIASLTEEKQKLDKEKENGILENENLTKKLLELKSLLDSSQVENVNTKETLALVMGERAKLENEKENYVSEKETLLTELAEWKTSMEALQVEIASLIGVLASEREDRSKLEETNGHFADQNKKFSMEILESQHLVESLRSEIASFEKERTRLGEDINRLSIEKEEVLTELVGWKRSMESLQVENASLKGVLMSEREDRSKLEETNGHLVEQSKKFSFELLESQQLVENLRLEIASFEKERSRLEEEINYLSIKKEEALTELTDCKTCMEDLQSQYEKSMSDFQDGAHRFEQLIVENVTLTSDLDMYKAKISEFDDWKMKTEQKAFQEMTIEDSSQHVLEQGVRVISHHETSGKTPSDGKLEDQSNSLEETFFKHMILDEFVKQYVSTVEAKKSELVSLCEDLRRERVIAKTKNSELTENLCRSESRINELQAEVDELQQLETLYSKLDACIGFNETDDGQPTSTRVANSVDQALAVIQELQEKLEDALRNHNLLSDSFKEMTEKTKDLEGRNELAFYVIHKVFDNLQKIVNDTGVSVQESQHDTTSEQLDHLEISNYDVFIEKLIMILRERAQLESKNREYTLELLQRIKDLEEFNQRCIHPEIIVKLFEDIQSLARLDDIEMKPDEPMSSLESIVQFFITNLKSNEKKLIELQNQIDNLTLSIVTYGIESEILKGSLVSATEQLGTVQSETQLKEIELHQSEQRVSALREKLHIAVTKGKGLIQQRDSLKQNLTATSNELEKCRHELQLKDATLQETETKLKNYSEAGERMEALESELSYIRNSATALRESFLLKDSVLQRIEEILEDLELPEDFHARDIIDKIDWLAKSISQSQFPSSISNQISSVPIERTRSYPESRALDGWREDFELSSGPDDELRRNYEELQNKFYGLAEQNEMLEQSLMERNNLVQHWEEVLGKINIPPQLRSLEPEDRIEWLTVSLSEANDRCHLLQQDINDLEKVRESLTADLEESQRRLIDLESALKSITIEGEQLSASLEVKSHDYNKICEKVLLYETEIDKLQKEVSVLRLKLDEKRVDVEHTQHLHGEIRRLQNLLMEMLQLPETEDLDSNTSDIQCLEALLRKLVDRYVIETSGLAHRERSVDQLNVQEELESKLEEVEGELVRVKDERERHVAESQSLVHEIDTLQVKNQELQNLLAQEEQKTAAVKEKLNVAVRKGKSLVQVRDSMKQTINDLTSQVERLNAEMKVRENKILELQQKMKDLFTFQELVENKDSEIQYMNNRLKEADSELQEKSNTLNMILSSLGEIDLGVDMTTDDPFEKMKQIEKVLQDLQVAISSAEHDSKRSKRAAELLVAELNEVQERNEDLLEELSRTTMERDTAVAAKQESVTRIEQLSALHLEERRSHISELMNLKSGLDQLQPGFSKIYDILNDVLPKDLDHLYNLESNVESMLELSGTSNVGGQTLNSSHGGISSKSEFKVNAHSELFLDSNDSQITDLWRFIRSHIKEFVSNVNGIEKGLQSHSKSLHEKVISLSEAMAALSRETTSHNSSIESAKEEIAWLESTCKRKETENLVLRKYVSVLYKGCKDSVLEIEKSKGQVVASDFPGEDFLSGEILSVSEEHIISMVNRLLSLVKEFNTINAENVEVNLNEMKSTISSLQRELTEKDVQKERICVDLVGQIKRAEAAAMSHLQELEPAKAQVSDLKGQCQVLEQRVKELEGQESVLVDLHGKVKSLTEAMTAKEQENEALLQALDEEEAQMEDLRNKVTELEELVQQKNVDLETAEAARGKALKKLSITVSRFDELHHLSETLVSEVDKLQSQLQERDSEISFLRDEVTRCTSDSLLALETDKRGLTEIQEILTWLDSMVSGVDTNNMHLNDDKINQVHEGKEILKKQITSIFSELKDLRQVSQSKDDQLHIERSKVDDLMRRRELLENSLKETESRLSLHENNGDSAPGTSMTSEIVEVEPALNKWPMQGTSMAPQVRSLRKVNNDQLAISINDMDSDDRDKLEDDDDDKAHGFKSLTTSKLVPRFTRPITDFVDGLWVSCDRTLMRQPALRLSLILYWAVMHALLAIFVV
uniref:putative leucine-rich repeat-containing protein DDB_G0290503 isoform X2 n=1 Tax=Erigeron canadensis TaxID=72917 RepID=UPI001CB9D07E|nr:putative leucine-rich repeat-containing protein DDB_G0290503 isoform X2 [Erigeron canadensis]